MKLTDWIVPQYFCSLGAAKLLHSLGSAILFLHVFHQFDEFFHFSVKNSSNWRFCKRISLIIDKYFRKTKRNVIFSYLVTSKAILLRDRRLGGYVFANPWESHFIPRGFAPWDEIRLPRVAKTIASRSAITQYYISEAIQSFRIEIDIFQLWLLTNFRA